MYCQCKLTVCEVLRVLALLLLYVLMLPMETFDASPAIEPAVYTVYTAIIATSLVQ